MSTQPLSLVDQVSERAQQIAVELAGHFGARPAGSPEETAARNWAETLLVRWGYTVCRQPVKFPPFPEKLFAVPLAGVYLAVSACLLKTIPVLAVLTPVMFYFLPNLMRWESRHRKVSQESENLFTLPRAEKPAIRLLLVAHLDSAPARSLSGLALSLYNRSLDIAQRVAFAIAAGAGLQLVGFTLPAGLVIFLIVLGLMIGSWIIGTELWNQFRSSGKFSPGANDNASGVGVVLAIAEYFASTPLNNVGLEFLITTAEETGMHGAAVFTAALDQKQPRRVLCFDTVGTGGELRHVVRDGTWKPLRFSDEMNNWIRQAVPKSAPLWYIEKSGDHAPFIKAGLPTAAVQVTGSPSADLRYHTTADTADYLELRSFQLAITAALAVIAKIDTQVFQSASDNKV